MDKLVLPEKTFYLASYPRSGNTWMINALAMLYSAVRSEALSTVELFPFIYRLDDLFYLRADNKIEPNRILIIKTHETYDIVKRDYPDCKSVYVYRDGRDVILSFYFFKKMCLDPNKLIMERIGNRKDLTAKTLAPVDFDIKEFSSFIREHATGWSSHVMNWLKDASVYAVRYEDLHGDFVQVMGGITKYLNVQPTNSYSDVKQEYVNKFRVHFTNNNQNFYRKGIIGDWKNYYTEEHSKIFSDIAGKVLCDLGYDV